MNKHKSNKIKENSNTVRHLIMGQIITTQNLVAIKVVRHAGQQVMGLDAWASRVKCPARFMSHLHKICIYMSCLWLLFVLLFVHYCKVMVCVVYWVGKWQPRSRGSTSMFGNLMAIYYIMLQFIQNQLRLLRRKTPVCAYCWQGSDTSCQTPHRMAALVGLGAIW